MRFWRCLKLYVRHVENKQDRQCTYDVIERRVLATIVAEAINIT